MNSSLNKEQRIVKFGEICRDKKAIFLIILYGFYSLSNFVSKIINTINDLEVITTNEVVKAIFSCIPSLIIPVIILIGLIGIYKISKDDIIQLKNSTRSNLKLIKVFIIINQVLNVILFVLLMIMLGLINQLVDILGKENIEDNSILQMFALLDNHMSPIILILLIFSVIILISTTMSFKSIDNYLFDYGYYNLNNLKFISVLIVIKELVNIGMPIYLVIISSNMDLPLEVVSTLQFDTLSIINLVISLIFNLYLAYFILNTKRQLSND